ncbi:MAG: hypothetical protein NT124_01465 [Candidatus Dependentiae bacterium]|nr:hypothetical protein [Candidatus Dependentiae bacterium]
MNTKKRVHTQSIFWLLVTIYMLFTHPCEAVTEQSVPADVTVEARQKAKIPLVICFLAQEAGTVAPLIPLLKRDFMFSGQIEVTDRTMVNKPSKKDIQQLFSAGYPLALFITQGQKNSFEWRLFDTLQGTMVNGKRYIKRGYTVDGWAHNIADSVWPTLTGQGAFFSAKIAYCKQVDLAKGKRAKHVYIADYDGACEQVLVDLPTINVAPRWNSDVMNPLLFYSEYTNENIRLMSVDIYKKRRIASSFDGVNMLPAFSRDGKKVAYCASHGKGNCQVYYGDKGVFKKITDNKGNNISPSLFDDGSAIVFCSDFQTGQPQIYLYTVANELVERVTEGGYCASPQYCGIRHQIAYGKIDKGVMQLYVYDIGTKSHTRLTTDAGNKEEYSWSPCGNYLLFSVEQGKSSRIAVLSLLTKERKYITPENIYCSYPSWSPLYSTYMRA